MNYRSSIIIDFAVSFGGLHSRFYPINEIIITIYFEIAFKTIVKNKIVISRRNTSFRLRNTD